MADEEMQQSEADKIRAKRLAMMQKRQAQDEQNKPAADPAPTPAPAVKSTPIKITPKPAVTAPVAPAQASSSTPRPIVPAQPKDSFEDFEHELITHVFGVTLSREAAEASTGDLIYLKALANELSEEMVRTDKLTGEVADRVLFARLSLDRNELTASSDPEQLAVAAALPEKETTFVYLLQSWKRAQQARGDTITRTQVDRVAAVDALKALCVSYAGLSVQHETMFPNNQPMGVEVLTDALMKRNEAATLMQDDQLAMFMFELAKRFDDDGLEDILGSVVASLSATIIAQSHSLATLEWRQPVAAIKELCESKAVASCLPKVVNWCPVALQQAQYFEGASLLGPLLRLGSFGNEVSTAMFKNARERTREDLESVSKTLRGTLNAHYSTLHSIFNNIAKSSPAAREAVLKYWSHAIKINAKRAGIRVDMRTVSSDNFVVGLQALLLAFCAPFMDRQGSKIDKVDRFYFRRAPERIDIGEETKIRAELDAARKFWAPEPGDAASANFISECFFLTAAAIHIGTQHLQHNYPQFSRRIHDLRSEVRRMEHDQSFVGTPHQREAEAALEQCKRNLEYFATTQKTQEVTLFDPQFVSLHANYASFMMTWLVRLVDPKGQHPKVPIELPLSETTPEVFSMLPEYFIADTVAFFTFISKYRPDLLADQPMEDLLIFLIVFLATPYINNPYVKGQMVEVLFYNIQPTPKSRNGALGDVINTNKFALRELMPALMRIYVDIETTGTHSQFYEKFNCRYYISRIFAMVWDNAEHRETMQRESANGDQFVKFANMMLNDTTFLMEESLTKLHQIYEIQQKKRDEASWAAMPEDERKAEEQKLEEAEQQATSWLQLANETIDLLKKFTGQAAEPFVRGEIVDRLAAMLDFNLESLAGPKCQELRVADAGRFHFQPREMLRDFFQIFIHLSPLDAFAQAVARDGRSYSHELFARATRIGRKHRLKSHDELDAFMAFADRVEAMKKEDEADDAAEEAPDEFLDPLTYTIMRDPVILPKAKQSIDRTTIAQHLLSDPRCPFTSTPLKLEECPPDVELKARIDAFIAQRKANRAAAPSDAMAVDA